MNLQPLPAGARGYTAAVDARPVLVAAANALREVDLEAVHATILRPYYPVSDLFRVVRDSDGLQLDFMATVHGLRSFEGVRDRARLTDIIKSKRAAARPQDLGGASPVGASA